MNDTGGWFYILFALKSISESECRGLCRVWAYLVDWSMITLKDRRMEFLLLRVLIVCYGFLSFVECRAAGLSSSFVRSEWPSVDIPLDNEVFALPKGQNAPQQVSLMIIRSWNIVEQCLGLRTGRSSWIHILKT